MVVEVTMVAVSTPMAATGATGAIGEIGEIEEIGVVDREIKLSVVTAASLQQICHGSSMIMAMVDTTTVR